MKQLPNIFTLINLFLGCVAIVLALQTHSITINSNDEFVSSFSIPENLALASLLLYAAAVVDFLDGFVARIFNNVSELGKQLDSLSDVVSFGAAPGVILYQLLRFSYMREENGLDVSILYLLPAFLFSMASAYRLAVFNLDQSQRYGFKGVPTPAAALLVASFPLMLNYGTVLPALHSWFINKYVLYALIVILSVLMVSRLPLMALKFRNYSFADNKIRYMLAAATLLAAIFLHWLAVPCIFVLYIVLSLATAKNA